jgi:hypothetical protein
MNDRAVILAATVVIVASAATMFGVAVLEPDTLHELRQQFQGDNGPSADDDTFNQGEFVHKHAHLYFLIDGERKELGDAYIERNSAIHFHHDDGIIHIEGSDATLAAAMDTLNITVNATCVRYGLDDETYCEGDDTELRLDINGDNRSVTDWLNHTIRQGDNMILSYGDSDQEIPDRFYESLPDGYAPGYDRL